MSLIKFTVGPVSSGKTVDLIIKAYQLQKIVGTEKVLIIKPIIDNRFSADVIKSASGLQIKITHLVKATENLLDLDLTAVKYIFLDEIQFFTVDQIEQLREISLKNNIEIHCYGLLNDFKLKMFEPSKRLFELCDDFCQLKTFCLVCSESKEDVCNEGTHNLRIRKEGDVLIPIVEGESIFIGGIETFLPVCYKCYDKYTRPVKQNIKK
jgi:thymidine kinase